MCKLQQEQGRLSDNIEYSWFASVLRNQMLFLKSGAFHLLMEQQNVPFRFHQFDNYLGHDTVKMQKESIRLLLRNLHLLRKWPSRHQQPT